MLKLLGFVIAKENEVVPAAMVVRIRDRVWTDLINRPYLPSLLNETCADSGALSVCDVLLRQCGAITAEEDDARTKEVAALIDDFKYQVKIRLAQKEADVDAEP